MRIPAVTFDFPKPVVVPAQKCGTCAYRVPATTEELEMTVMYYRERPEAHPCHERRGVYCHGAHEQVVELERLVALRMVAQ
jgi:hypothetical protein